MSYFNFFKDDILSLPGVWQNENDIYFSQMKDGYSAAYKPLYPNGCNKDIIINTINNSGAYLRGNYEVIIFLETKYTALYFKTIEEVKSFFL